MPINNQIIMIEIRNPGGDISFLIFTRKEIETKRIRKEIKTIISRLNHFLSFLSNIQQKRNWNKNPGKEIKTKNISNISFIQHNAGLQLVDFFTNGRPGLYWYIEILCWYIEIFKLNKRLNKFSFYSAKYWKGKIRSHLNDMFVVSISFLLFLI